MFRPTGVRVVFIDETAECVGLKLNDVITMLEGKRIRNIEGFDTALDYVTSEKPITMIVNGGPGSCTALDDNELGIKVGELGSKGIKFGLDLVGGENFVLSSENELSPDDVSYVSSVLKKRLKVVGLKSSDIYESDGMIIIRVPTGVGIESILMNGKFETVIEQPIKLSNGLGEVKIGSDSYDIFWDGSKLEVSGIEYDLGEYFSLGDVNFRVTNATNVSATVDALILGNNDIEKPELSSGYVKYDTLSRMYQFSVPVDVSENGSKRFSDVTDSLMPLYQFDSDLLNGMLIYYIDGEEISQLPIPSDMSGLPIQSIVITGGELSMRLASEKKTNIEIMMEGSFEDILYIKSVEKFSSTFAWIIWIVTAVLSVCAIVLFANGIVSYKNMKISLIGVSMWLLGIIYIFGVAALSQSMLAFGWMLDRFAMIGICVFSVVSVVQIILLSERYLKKRRILKRYNNFIFALFIISFISLFTEFGGFGIALNVGILSSLLTTPVYVKYINK